MTKKEIFNQHQKPIAFISTFGGVEIYHIEGDQVYFKAYCWSDCYNKNNKRNQQHKARVYYNDKHAYFIFKGIRLSLAEALRIDAI